MKKVVFMAVAVLFSVTSAFALSINAVKTTPDSTKKAKTAKVIYTCTMHPEVILDKPGKCPKCGMSLVKKVPAAKKAAAMKM